MNNVFSISDFIGKAAGVRPGSLIWSAYHPNDAVRQRDGDPVGVGLYFQQQGLAHWNLAWSVSPRLQGLKAPAEPAREPFQTYVLLQHLIGKEVSGMPLTDLAGCMTLSQFTGLAEEHPEDLTRWTRAEHWPGFFNPHKWIADLKRLT